MSSGGDSSLAPPSGFLSSEQISGLGYGLSITVGILLLITTITLMSYFCSRVNTSPTQPSRPHGSAAADGGPDVEAGLDEAILRSYPTVLYSEAKLREKGTTTITTASCCSICLADYKDTDVLRLLPDCGHLFHLQCVDLWLRSRPTCPVCRSSPLPSPLPSPLAEVIPLAIQS
ncbi:RING-H2 finger protein ATL70-like [Elaeis guineensis]|uniref:RING-H2 finger protein ATL70-like n=1 Tax=Elaeis guineensis var. tenera TaxID=51953 RepID=A0A6I9S3Z4_ELAGV|nr:RING-H2 finger protein ATL70-like [Elaeis guineensis]